VATLYREGPELDQILAELDGEYPGQVHVSDVVYRRDGGVLGFFAHRRVGVHYTLGEFDGQPVFGSALMTEDERPLEPTSDGDPLDQLLVMAERAEQAHRRAQLAAEVVESGRPLDTGPEDESTNVEFARMLLELAAQKASERQSREVTELGDRSAIPQLPITRAPIAVPLPPVVAGPEIAPPTSASGPVSAPVPMAAPGRPSLFAPLPAPIPAPMQPLPAADPSPPAHDDEPAWSGLRRPIGAHRISESADEASISFAPAPVADSTNPLVLRRRLVELGVPVDWIPDGSGDPYWVTGQLVGRLPAPPTLTLEPGETLVVAGPGAAALRTAHHLAARLRIDQSAVRLAGTFSGEPTAMPRIDQAWQARDFVAEVERLRAGAIVVVSTDATTDDAADAGWATGIINALRPARLWLVVEATWKPADTTALITQVGPVDAVAVIGAARTTSPASIWQLPTPVAMLDGQFATRGAWTALLIDKLTGAV
jgi:hypothetical protein